MKITQLDKTTKRLDKYLSKNFSSSSRSVWQNKIKKGEVLVNGKKVTAHYLLKIEDNIEISNELDEKKEKSQAPLSWQIIVDAEDYLVVNKPAGLLVHKPQEKSQIITLADMLLEKYSFLEKVGENKLRPGIVHRLDKNVSGLLVIAKNPEMYLFLKKQFQNRQVKKIYQGLVYGKMPQAAGVIDFPIARSTTGKMVARPKSQTGKIAITEYETKKEFPHFTLLTIKLLTGRTHQIRLHLSAVGHPLVGETLHVPKKLKLFKDIDRIFLHSHQLGFYDISGTWKLYTAPLPDQLQNILKKLA